MRKLLCGLLIGVCLWWSTCEPVSAQQPPPPAQQQQPDKGEREGPSVLVPYTLAALAAIIVMLLVCMPVRRD